MKRKGDIECPRCTGLMVPDRFQDLQDDTGRLSFYGWRCPSCGEIIDPLIMVNRQRRQPTTVTRKRKFVSNMAVLVFLLFIPCALYALSPDAARKELARLSIPYSADELIEHAAMGDVATVQLFLDTGMDVNAKNLRGMTALMAAAEHGHADMAQVLLAQGADAHARNKSGATALMLATLLDRAEIVQLIEKTETKK